ncbi:MAG: TRAP transporter small permease [Polaromonas sp.]|uniref:TRAP transporter small permease n=1 Tax=Polaromonas sp. TaxID=1869339 RepID=UPI002487B3DD|nr:TRAP transporter small permease [Polaromonas sp.]MDI1238548.1 TRAP transporter small permease [Polaromonas sp.]MDI1341570.1 TRAP transporter small permease [Polaromonas sp.]
MNKLIERVCGLLAAIALFAIMALTFFDVGGRKLLSNSITGSLELTELLMVVVIFAALPLVSLRGEHVVFDSLDHYLPEAVRKVQRALMQLICGVVLLALGWLMWQTGGQYLETGETTAQLLILKAPFIYGMAVLCALAGLIHLGMALRPASDTDTGEGVTL